MFDWHRAFSQFGFMLTICVTFMSYDGLLYYLIFRIRPSAHLNNILHTPGIRLHGTGVGTNNAGVDR